MPFTDTQPSSPEKAPSLLRRFGKGSTGVATSLLALAALVFVFGGPYIVYYGFPEQAYKITLVLGLLAIAAAVLFGLLAIAKTMRAISGVALSVCGYVVGAFLWVWSVMIVGQIWGMGTLFFANLFFGFGTIVTAFAAALFTTEWGVFGQLVLVAGISIGLTVAGSSLQSKS